MADDIESIQLGMAGDLLGHAAGLLSDRKVTGAEIHFLANWLTESLREVERVAESRGARLGTAGTGPDVNRSQCQEFGHRLPLSRPSTYSTSGSRTGQGR